MGMIEISDNQMYDIVQEERKEAQKELLEELHKNNCICQADYVEYLKTLK